MATLRVVFKVNTSHEWAAEKLTEIGLHEVEGFLETTEECHNFLLMTNLKHLDALVTVPNGEEITYMRIISMLSPQIVSVSTV